MRIEPELAAPYRKIPEQEQFLNKINTILAPYEEAEYQDLPETYPQLFIIGAPRAGTTLLYQLISQCLDVGFINNLSAFFWRAPVYGIKLAQKVLPDARPSSFASEFGRTHRPDEPHEFGYFWSAILNYEEMLQKDKQEAESIDWTRLKRVLTNITYAFERPVCHKTLLLDWHIQRILNLFKKAIFIYIRRDPVHNALSILNYRERFLGSVDAWVSVKPKEYAWLQHEPYWKQVVGQIFYLEKHIDQHIQKIEPERILSLTYETLCEQPGLVLEKIRNALEQLGHPTTILFDPPHSFKTSTYTPTTNPHYARVLKAVSEFYSDSFK